MCQAAHKGGGHLVTSKQVLRHPRGGQQELLTWENYAHGCMGSWMHTPSSSQNSCEATDAAIVEV